MPSFGLKSFKEKSAKKKEAADETAKATTTSDQKQVKPGEEPSSPEGENLVSRDLPTDKPLAKYTVDIYRADGLPRAGSGLAASFKKAFSSDNESLSPYVHVTLGKRHGKTAVKNKTCAPVWNQQIIFIDVFPPVNYEMKIQIKDSQVGNDDAIAVQTLNLKKFSNRGEKGFLPTFGPSFIHFYGAKGNVSKTESSDEKEDSSESEQSIVSEGVTYRGRLLLAIKVDILDSVDEDAKSVDVQPAAPFDEHTYDRSDEFILFATIFESNMMDKTCADKSFHYEIMMGNGQNVVINDELDTVSVDTVTTERTSSPSHKMRRQSSILDSAVTTTPIKAKSGDRNYCYMPYENEKPCMYQRFMWSDQRRRVFNSNVIEKIGFNLQTGIAAVQEMLLFDRPEIEAKLIEVLTELIAGCAKYADIAKECNQSWTNKNMLDKERMKLALFEFEKIAETANNLISSVNKHNIDEKVKVAQSFMKVIKEYANDPQQSFPDIFIWMMAGKKKKAYQRLSAKDFIFSIVPEESGSLCGKIHDVFLKKKKGDPNQLVAKNRLKLYMWFGDVRQKRSVANGLPKGFRDYTEITSPDMSNVGPPTSIVYEEKHVFQLRAHVYQARSLHASDSSGLSDPFVKVFFDKHCQLTQIKEETLNPTWDEMLVYSQVTVYGSRDDILREMPSVVVEIYDKDKVGKSEFLGRCITQCYVRFADQSYRCPELQWLNIQRGSQQAGQLLAAFELIQIGPKDSESGEVCLSQPKSDSSGLGVFPVPVGIRPTLSLYKIEIVFWGVRNLKKIQFMSVDKPRVGVECSSQTIQSTVIKNMKKNQNFSSMLKYIDIELPDQEVYCPPVTITTCDCRSFGRFTLVGSHTIGSLSRYLFKGDKLTLTKTVPKEILLDGKSFFPRKRSSNTNLAVALINGKKRKSVIYKDEPAQDEDEAVLDWWTRYYNSYNQFIELTGQKKRELYTLQKVLPKPMLFKIYPCELEMVPEYDSFQEWLKSFQLYRGKKKDDEDEDDDRHRIVGTFKGAIQVFHHPVAEDLEKSRVFPSNDPIAVFLRIYVVRAFDLPVADFNGKADPFLSLRLGSKKKIKDKDNYVPNTLNPVFGKWFEFEAVFPFDSTLTIQVWDWDLIGGNDLLGETVIDVENRFYSRHRATCGLSQSFDVVGINKWRDALSPSQILAQLCSDLKLNGPTYIRNAVKVGETTFVFQLPESDVTADGIEIPSPEPVWYKISQDQMALSVLNKWNEIDGHLLCEHVETRSLYHPDRPGVEQGKLEMWIDMFPMSVAAIPPPVDISPRKAKGYELRVIIYNTEDVVLEDDNVFTGEKMSDIFIKGWVVEEKEAQKTDIHYRSLTGEGNFNWRFVFPFDYLPAEEKIVISKKSSFFSMDETETKVTPQLTLQVWDADSFSADDFLGAITLNLNNFPRGARSAKLCTLDMIKSFNEESGANKGTSLSIFKQPRARGWWPMWAKNESGEIELMGKKWRQNFIF